MKARLTMLCFGLAAVAILSLGLQAQERGAVKSKDDITATQQQLEKQFAEFQDALFKLKTRLSRGTPEERKRAEFLDKVLDECKNLAIKQEFGKMIQILRTADLSTTGGSQDVGVQSEVITNSLRKVLEMMQNTKLDFSDGRKDLERILKDLQDRINEQRQLEIRTLRDKDSKVADQLAKEQRDAEKKTKELVKDIDKLLGKDGKGKGGEADKLKGENKEGKGGEEAGKAKNAGEQKNSPAQKGETRDGGKESKEAKGAAKPGENKGGEPKTGEPKAGAKADGKGAEGSPKAGSKANDKAGPKGGEGKAKENKGDDKGAKKGQEGGAKDAGEKKGGDPMSKDGAPQGSAKGDPKSGDPKAGDPKAGAPDSKAKAGGDPMGGGGKPNPSGPKNVEGGQAKGGDAKAGEAQGGAGADQGASKPGDSKDGQGSAKDGGGPAPEAGGAPPGGQAGQKGDPKDGGSPPPGAPKGGDDQIAKSGKKIQEAGYDQGNAADDLKKKDNAKAAKNQGDAIQKMEEAKKKLEKLLQQMREEEIERVLAALQARCETMLRMQIQVLAGTEDLDKLITTKRPDKMPTRADKNEANGLADKEKEIVQEANKCIDILKSEGTAVAFPEVFQQIRDDMIHVQKRLELADAGGLTQDIERDIIATLKEMIDALKKARDDNQSDPGKPGKSGPPGKPGDQKLLELLQELKMVRSLQKRINDRTSDYAKRFPGEQARDPRIVPELRALAERQQRIQQIVSDIAKGANK